MFLSREIDIKPCQIYTKIHIYMYIKIVGADHIQQICNQSEYEDITEKPYCYLDFLQLLFYYFYLLRHKNPHQ